MPLKDQHILGYMETLNLNKKCKDDRYTWLLFVYNVDLGSQVSLVRGCSLCLNSDTNKL